MKVCGVSGCYEFTNGSYCDEHTKIKNRKRDRRTSQEKYYGKQWVKISKMFLRKNPICENCGGLSQVVHHIVERSMGGSDRDDNLKALCRSCHSKLHSVNGFGK